MQRHNKQPRGSQLVLWIITFITAMMIFCGQPLTAQAQTQWTSNGNNISNTNSGNVGIGTTAPVTKLEVAGAATIDSDATGLLLNSAAGANRARTTVSGTNSTALLGFDVLDSSGSGWRNVLNLNGSGNVGIGTSSPGTYFGNPARLDVTNTASHTNLAINAGSGFASQVIFAENGTGKWIISSRNTLDTPNNRLSIFNSTPTEVFTILNGGNVGIGTASPGLPLEIVKNQNAGTGTKVGNTTAGTGAFSYLQTTADAASGYFYTFSSSYTTNNLYVADGTTLEAGTDASGGLNLLANASNGVIRFGTGGNTERMRIDSNGNVGIGTTTPGAKLDVNGSVNVSGNINARYSQDVAEWVPATQSLPAGTVVVLNPNESNQVMASAKAYDTRVAGVVSAKPALALGEAGTDKVLVATTGRVKVKVDATRAPIHVGDLLVTSDQEGVAMKSVPVNLGGVEMHRPGTLIGKALEPLEKGTGEILVLLSLQ